MHNENPLIHARVDHPSTGRVDCQSTDQVQPTNGRLYNSQAQGMEQQRQRAKRTALWVGAVAVLVYVGFILSGVLGQ